MTGDDSGELLLRRARLSGSPDAVDVTISAGRIARISPASEGSFSGRAVDLGGRWLVPGLWDNHVHFTQWAQTARRLDVARAESAAGAAALVGERLRGGGDEVVGFGFRDGLWPDAPSRGVLDAVSGPVPVVLVSGDLHSVWLNSAALAAHGHADHPSGLLREDDCFAVVRSLENVPTSTMDAWVADAARAAAARGVVGIVELEMSWNLGEWRRRIAAGNDLLRVEFGVYTQHLDRAIAEGLRSGELIGETHGMLTVGPYKVIIDGSLNTRTAYCFDPYPGLEGSDEAFGLLTVPPSELVPLMRRAATAGIRPAVHAIGDHANALALDAFAEVGCAGSIEHAQLLTEHDLRRFAALGVTASVQPEHALDDRDVAERYWSGRTDRAFMLADLEASGASLVLGSDAPVAPLDPWVTIAAAVGRTRDGREPWHPEQALSRPTALAASTRGTVAAGEVADLVAVETDPTMASVEELRRMPVAATLLAGRFTHNAL
ncbi:amidohydrolase [Luethyella okanaganae]|uniref:Amidohydrolase n=1 Tax=Luethyella okanaganae TaxID=69372 RepID=A0ABW1VDL5_9MICO